MYHNTKKPNMKNFNPTHFNNGDQIPVASSIEQFNVVFEDVKTPYRININGVNYYNKYAVDDPRGIIPPGHRFPTVADVPGYIPRSSYVMETALNTGRALAGCWLKDNILIGTFRNVTSAQALILDYYGDVRTAAIPHNWGFQLYFVKL